MQLPHPERLARLRLARTDGIGPVTFRRLLDRFGTAQRAVDALPDMSKKGGRAKPLVAFPQANAEAEMAKLDAMGATLLLWGDPDYPQTLAAIEDAPITLTALGDASLLRKTAIGIVGSRNASLQGRRFTETLADGLGRAGLVVVSGLARGIDTAAHGASLATGTVACVAGGIDVIYPLENKGLYESIVARGCVVAENPLGMQPLAQHFPRRNRIISGLAFGVAIVEATAKSGSLITARMAADQGREVFAVPGHPFDPRASGPNSLIRDGAVLITGAADILDTLAAMATRRIVAEPAPMATSFSMAEPDDATLSDARNTLTSLLSTMPVDVDSLVRESGIPAPLVLITLLELELAGRLVRHPQNRVSMPFYEEAMDRSATLL